MSIVSNFIKIASTGVFVQFISFLFYPFIGRLYSPNEFGYFSFFSSCVLISSVFATGQFYYAVTTPKEDVEAYHLLSLSCWSVTLFSILIFVALIVFRFFIVFDLQWFLFPLYLLAYSLFECFKLITIRTQSFTPLNVSQIINRLGSNVFKTIRPISNGSLWLLFSEIICFVASNLYLYQKVNIKILPLRKLNFSLIVKYKDFPLFHSTSLFIQFLISELPVFYFKSQGELDLLGYYSMGNRLFVQPCLLIGYSLHPVLIHRFNDNLNLKTVSKVFAVLSVISIGALTVSQLYHQDIITILVGKKWMLGADIFKVQLWMIISKFFMGTVLALMISQNKSRYIMTVRGVEFAVLAIFVYFLDLDFLITFVICEVAAELFLVFLSLKISANFTQKLDI